MHDTGKVKKAILFLTPAVFLILLFYGVPAVLSVFYSFTNKSLVGVHSINWDFVGFQNYVEMFVDKSF